jgi:hypothetical protein
MRTTRPRKRREDYDPWTAPEHYRGTVDLDRDELGEIKVDPRPTILVPPKPKMPFGFEIRSTEGR